MQSVAVFNDFADPLYFLPGRRERHGAADALQLPEPVHHLVEPAVHRHPAHHHPAADHVHLLQPADRRRTDVRRGQGLATIEIERTAARWMPFELSFEGPSTGNPFVEVEFTATFRSPDGAAVDVGGFYAGHGRYFIRLLPGVAGAWSFTTSSNEPLLDQLSGGVRHRRRGREGARARGRLPLRATRTARGTGRGGRPRTPGTTRTRRCSRPPWRPWPRSPFTKLRMCLFPKHFVYNSDEPERFPFPRDRRRIFDHTRFDLEFFARLDEQVAAPRRDSASRRT